MKDRYYLVYRIFKNQKIFYGWSTSKTITKQFRNQRSKKKYMYGVIDRDELEDKVLFNENTMITYVSLYSNKYNGEYIFFTTQKELDEAEANIYQLVNSMSLFSRLLTHEERSSYIRFFYSLNNVYITALQTIGYYLPELNNLYDDEYIYEEREEDYRNIFYDSAPYTKCIYSLESFVKVLKNYL